MRHCDFTDERLAGYVEDQTFFSEMNWLDPDMASLFAERAAIAAELLDRRRAMQQAAAVTPCNETPRQRYERHVRNAIAARMESSNAR